MEKQIITTYEEAVAYLYHMPRFTEKHSMEDTKAHLLRLGSPDKRIKNIIHVAGTNGKGSVCTYLRYCLEEAGYRVAVFTSPHLTDIRERFVVEGGMISREDFLRIFLQVYESLNWESLNWESLNWESLNWESLDWESLNRENLNRETPGYHPTFFEYVFFMGMLYFAEKQPDYCILETGLGGRLDATNAVAEKRLAIITRIGLDHVEYLGNTLAEIAGEKAGILKKGTPFVYCADVPEAAEVFVEWAKNLEIPAFPVSKNDYAFQKFHNKTIDFSLHTRYYGYIGITLRTSARYQMENAAIAVRGLEALFEGKGITAEEIKRGLFKAFWPGRMEEIFPDVFVDGAHNVDGIRAFLDTVRTDGCGREGKRRTLVFSVVQDKDYGLMIRQVLDAAVFDRIYVPHMETARAADLEKLKALWESTGGAAGNRTAAEDGSAEGGMEPELHYCANVREAMEEALKAQNGARIYAAGSLYLVGEIKEFLDDDKF